MNMNVSRLKVVLSHYYCHVSQMPPTPGVQVSIEQCAGTTNLESDMRLGVKQGISRSIVVVTVAVETVKLVLDIAPSIHQSLWVGDCI